MGAKVKKFTSQDEKSHVWAFHCPGCGHEHPFDQRWEFNGNVEAPTFTPSLRVNGGTENECHLVMTDGKIIFQSDCHHVLKGQTIEMPDYEN